MGYVAPSVPEELAACSGTSLGWQGGRIMTASATCPVAELPEARSGLGINYIEDR